MAERSGSGSTGILGVVIGVLLVLLLAFLFFGGIPGGDNSPDTVNLEVPAPADNNVPAPTDN